MSITKVVFLIQYVFKTSHFRYIILYDIVGGPTITSSSRTLRIMQSTVENPLGDPRGIAIPQEKYEESLLLFLEE